MQHEVLKVPDIANNDFSGEVRFTVESLEPPFFVTVHIELVEESIWGDEESLVLTPEVQAVTVAPLSPFHDPGVTNEMLRSIPVASLSFIAGNEILERATGESLVLVTPQQAEQARSDGPTEKTLRLVAGLYAHADALGKKPVAELVTTFGVSRSTATRWVRLARESGFLEPSKRSGK
ncbi:helix-turn-helix domain containing protein [Dermabacter sp. p3-SID358]|uniref:helix-turn-helix domain-containing protein n=1 Tax=Dermabacter sp. p3-SID358 TaxID=2916114 RepID=UPI0021A62829|nr:helix-turn-helix domain-containing protein [Dermabacter sp. p3-SID358]MCT1866405.1 helix-turn-helix domain containing protein [Dermabacter sp. p3-SID358]